MILLLMIMILMCVIMIMKIINDSNDIIINDINE